MEKGIMWMFHPQDAPFLVEQARTLSRLSPSPRQQPNSLHVLRPRQPWMRRTTWNCFMISFTMKLGCGFCPSAMLAAGVRHQPNNGTSPTSQ